MTNPSREESGDTADAVKPTNVTAHYCVTDEEEIHLPRRRRHPRLLPRDVPLPRVGELVYLSSTSSWSVKRIVYEWRNSHDMRIQVWLEYEGPTHFGRPPGFELTQ